jgi:hypothetical protein
MYREQKADASQLSLEMSRYPPSLPHLDLIMANPRYAAHADSEAPHKKKKKNRGQIFYIIGYKNRREKKKKRKSIRF